MTYCPPKPSSSKQIATVALLYQPIHPLIRAKVMDWQVLFMKEAAWSPRKSK
jgi:hypothetical protein